MTRVRSLSLPALGLAALAVAACRGESTAPQQLAAVQVTAPGDSVIAPTPLPLAVTLTDTRGRSMTATVAWSTLDPATARVDGSGVVTPLMPGEARVVATVQDKADTVRLRVLEAAAAVAVLPRALTLAVTATGTLDPLVTGASGAPLAGRAVVLTSSNPGVLRVSGSGAEPVVTGVAAGTAELTARVEGLTTTVAVTVEAPGPSAFDVTMRFVGSAPPEMEQLVRAAAERWTRVIGGALTPVRLDVPEGACGLDEVPPLREVVANVLVLVKLDSIDGRGRILGQAGPCIVRGAGTRLPAVGIVYLDTADVRALIGNGTARDVIIHEVGHVLGLGTRWRSPAPLLDEADVTNIRYTGAAARRAQAQLGFSLVEGTPVPIESFPFGCTAATLVSEPLCASRLGTAGGHWSESYFGSELMTGFANRGGMPLSTVTVGGLRDLGYDVRESGADIVTPRRVQGAPVPAGLRGQRLPEEVHEIRDVIVRPRWELGPDGRPRPLP
jgi:hypothetical protein